MSRYRATNCGKKAYIASKIRAYYRHKQMAELIPDNEHVVVPRPKADAVVIIRLRGQPQIQFSNYRNPWGGWTISPTLAGKKLQQVFLHA